MKSRFSKRFGKITAVFLSACVIAGGGLAEIGGIAGSGIGTLTAEAATIVKTGYCGSRVSYTLDSEGTLTISGSGEMYSYDNEYASTKSPFYSNSKIINVKINRGVTNISKFVFYNCTNLESITIPYGVTSIGSNAFNSCSKLSDIIIPSSVSSIGDYAFAKCSNLTSMTIPDGVTVIKDHTFSSCTSLTNIVIPDSVTVIKDHAFYDCSSLSNITIPDGVTSIEMETFARCSSLTKIKIPSKVTSIAMYAFCSCNKIKNIFIPNNVITIGERALGYYFDGSYKKLEGFTLYGTPGTAAENYANDNGFAFFDMKPLDNISALSNTNIYLGESVNITGSANGGTESYQYAFFYKKIEDESFSLLKTLNTTATASFKPESTGTYIIRTYVSDDSGNIEAKDLTLDVYDVFENTSSVSSTDIILGKTITATASATGGAAPYQYAFYYKKVSDSKFVTKSGFSDTDTVTIRPAAATDYIVLIKVKDSTGEIVSKEFTVTVNPKLENTSSVVSTNIIIGDSIIANASATGGRAPYKYAFYFKKASEKNYRTKSGFSDTNTVSIKPSTATDYNIVIKVKDAAGTVLRKEFTVTVNPKLKNTSELSASTISFGDTVTVTASATGGITPYQYAFYYKEESAAKWTTAKGYSSSDKVTILPLNNTNYNIVVKVKDAAGTVARKEFLLTVTA